MDTALLNSCQTGRVAGLRSLRTPAFSGRFAGLARSAIAQAERRTTGQDARQQRIVRVQAAPAVAEAPAKTSAARGEYDMFTLTTWLLRWGFKLSSSYIPPVARGLRSPGVILENSVEDDEESKGTIDGELATVLSSIATACKQIASLVNRAGISNLTGLAGQANVQGEDQKKLDVVSNEVFCNALRASGRTGIIASEEEDEPVAVEETFSGNYVVVFDPLDGSSNLDAGISTGSIFGIYEPSEECNIADMDDPEKMMKNCVMNVCQPGNALLAAGYCLYSSSIHFVLTIGKGVWGFTYDSLVGEFVLTHPDLKVPEKGMIYSFNEGNYGGWDPRLQKYMDSLKDDSKWGGKPYSSRYIGSLVGDFHRTLLYGGIYGYPGDKKNPNGKLRLLYECAPMSFIMEQAGGKGSTGVQRVLDVNPDKVHQRVPLFIGSPGEVDYVESFFK